MNKSIIAVALAILLPLEVFAAQQPLQTRANTTTPSVDTNFSRQQLMNTELYANKADKAQVVRYWADHADGTTLAVGTLVAYEGKIYATTQAFLKTSGSTPFGFSAYFEPIAGATYTLPAATTSTLGGVKDGAGVTIAADGTISADDQLVGDCAAGPCLDGTSDGGNYIKLWAGTGSYWTALQGGSPAANRSWRLPIAAPPAAGTTYLMNMDEYGQMGFVPAVSDTTYGVGWNGDTGAASKNAIYDKIETIAGGSMTYPGAGLPISTGTAWDISMAVATTIGETGADTNIPTEQAVREAITALPAIAFGPGLTVATDTPSAGTDTVSVTTNTYQAYDADLTTWAGVTPGVGVATALAVNVDTVGGLPTLISKGVYTVDTASIAANTCASSVAVTATGVATTDVVIATPNLILSTIAGFGVTTAGAVRVDIYPTSGNVNFQFCNPTSAAIDPGSVTFNWKVLR